MVGHSMVQIIGNPPTIIEFILSCSILVQLLGKLASSSQRRALNNQQLCLLENQSLCVLKDLLLC